jgi:hypothetical protein
VLRKLDDLLRNNQVTPELEQATGMSREEMEQFVTKFKKPPKSQPGAGQEIPVKPGQAPKFDPNRALPDLNPGASVSSRNVRDRGSVARDDFRDNLEGTRFLAPREILPWVEAYRNTLSRSKVVSPPRAAPVPTPRPGGR